MWTVHVCRPDLTRYGEAQYSELVLEPVFNDLGSWSMTLHGDSPMAAVLKQPGWGVEVVDDDGEGVLAGTVDDYEDEWDGRRRTLTVKGFDDNLVLQDRVVHPEPASTVPPYSTSAYDQLAGTASSVMRLYAARNLGSSAIGPRQVSGFTLGTDPVVGASIYGRGRWNNLLEFLQGLALIGGGLGFRVARVDGSREFQVYQPVDRSSSVIFSTDRRNITQFKRTVRRPTVNYAYVGGGGELTARTIREGSDSASIVEWNRRVEKFIDQRHTTDTAELDQEITKTLEEGQGESTLEITAVDVEGATWRTNYSLGDTVTAVIDDEVITQAVRRVRVDITPRGPQTVRPVLGNPVPHDPLRIFTELRSIGARLRKLEAR